MMPRRVGYGLAVLVLVAGIFWLARSGRQTSQSTQNHAPSAATSAPAGPASVAAPSVATDRGIHKTTPASIWRKPIDIVADDGTAGVPRRYQFAGVERVQTGRDFEDWMAHFSEADQKILRAFDKQFYGIYKNRTPDQIAWMAAKGHPMPEDVLAAQMMGTQALRDLSNQGNIKATFLLEGRELTEMAKAMKSEGKSYSDVVTGNKQWLDGHVTRHYKIMESDSPYRAFMIAREGTILKNDQSDALDARVISALYFASILGDQAAYGLVQSFVNSAPNTQARQHRLAVSDGASSLYMQLSLQHTAVPPYGVGCMKLFCSLDPYPSPVPGQAD